MTFNPTLDTSKGTSIIPFSPINRLRLLDTWRCFHEKEKDYTFYSHARQTYSRIDYISTSKDNINWIKTAAIQNIIWSDHAAAQTLITLPNKPKAPWRWKLNDSLLDDNDCLKELQDSLTIYKNAINADPALQNSKWQALKCLARGILIKHGLRWKKIKQEQINKLLAKVHELESLHKTNQSESVLNQLTQTRLDLHFV